MFDRQRIHATLHESAVSPALGAMGSRNCCGEKLAVWAALGNLPWAKHPFKVVLVWMRFRVSAKWRRNPTCILVVGSNEPNLALAIPKVKREKEKDENDYFSLLRRPSSIRNVQIVSAQLSLKVEC